MTCADYGKSGNVEKRRSANFTFQKSKNMNAAGKLADP